ncbi:MAG: YciI family protein [Devosiaceae bacterium]|nr:YciI family protein [Devosiaceae bacterium]
MQFVIIGEDGKNRFELRLQTRPDHLAYWKEKGGVFLAGGPFLNQSEQPIGSMIIIEAESLEQAKKWAAADPYMVAGVFETLSVKRWNWIFGNPNSN